MKNMLTDQTISDDALKELVTLARDQWRLEVQARQLEEQLERTNQKYRELTEKTIPDKMMELGMEAMTLKDGSKLSVHKFYAASIPPDLAERAFKWLRENQHDGLIKSKIDVTLGRGEDEMASKIIAFLKKLHANYVEKESVHPQTLKAFVREMIEGGKPIPLDLLGVHVGSRSKLTPPKQ